MTKETLKEKILSALINRGELDACQLAMAINYPLGGEGDLDEEFFNQLRNLESDGRIYSKPISSEIPNSDDSDSYTGKVYRFGKPLRQVFRELTDIVKRCF